MKIEEIPFDRIFPAQQKLTPQEKANREKFKEFLEYVRIRATDRYVFPPEILTVDEITVATVGNFSASVGKPKSRKTFNVSAIVAALLSGKEVLHYRAKLPDGKTKVLYIDTEQSRVHCFKITDNVDSLDFPEIHCHVQFLKSVSLSLSYLYSLPSLTTMPFAIRCLSHITNEVRPRL